MPESTESGEAILQRIVELVEDGQPLDVEALRSAFPGRKAELRRALGGLESYLEARRLLVACETHSPLLAPGEELADFEIVSAVGRGGMGEVYLAREKSLGGRPVALKILRPTLAGSANRRRFEREARLLARLRHPSLAEVYRCGEQRGIPFLCMRFVRGRSLRDWQLAFRADPPDDLERIAVRWGTQVAEALAHVHENGLVHRDVKPMNIIVEEGDATDPRSNRAVLVDFGLVRAIDSLATTASSPATMSFAPPEQILGRSIDARADVFSLGVTLHDLLAGRLPLERERAAAGLEPLEQLRPGVDRDLAAIVAKAVDPDPRWRYRDGRELSADLRRWTLGKSVHARRAPSAGRRWSRLFPRKRLVRRIVLGSLLFVVGWASFELRRANVRAAELTEAGALGDLSSLARASHAIPAWTRPLLLDSGAKEVLARLESPGNRLAEAVRLERAGEPGQALRMAAVCARVEGLAECEPLRACLVRALAPTSPLRLEALRLVARVFYERPDQSPEDVRASAPLREALMELRRHALSAEEGFLVVTALSGCGGIAEAEVLLDWALDGSDLSEQLRLGACSVERILFRSLACGLPDTASLARIEARVAPFTEAFVEAGVERDDLWHLGFGVTSATLMLNQTLSLVRRALPGVAGLASERECMLEQAVVSGRLPVRIAATALAAQRSPALRPFLLRAALGILSGRDECTTWSSIGFCCALSEDRAAFEALRLLAVLSLLSRGSSESLAGLGLGVQEGALLPSGLLPASNLLDPDTLLGATVPSYTGELEVRYGGMDRWLAAWSFTEPHVVVLDGARGVAVGECRMPETPDEPHRFLKFSSFGSSWVRLHFELTAFEGGPVVFELGHVVGARPYSAYAGVVALDVYLDRTFIGAVVLEMNHAASSKLSIDPNLLTPSEHVIEVRSKPDTTTTYRLHWARLYRP